MRTGGTRKSEGGKRGKNAMVPFEPGQRPSQIGSAGPNWLMTTGHGHRSTTAISILLLNIMLRVEHLAGAVIEGIGTNINDVIKTGDSLEMDLFPTLPMTFGTQNSSTIVAQTGSTALIPCTVHNIGDGMVSWIRRKDVQQLLTVGLTTYASDERFQAIHFQHSEDWTLQVKYVQQRDSGLYECQVSTHPPTSIFLLLQVVDARAEIAGPVEKFVRPGSTLQLHCMVKKSTETPSYLFWYHNARMVNYDVDRGVKVSTNLPGKESFLEVPRTSGQHSGNYTCEASNAKPARVLVHIFNGDNPAAMQHSAASSPSIVIHFGLVALGTIGLRSTPQLCNHDVPLLLMFTHLYATLAAGFTWTDRMNK